MSSVVSKLRFIADRHKLRYEKSSTSNAQLAKKVKQVIQSIAELASSSDMRKYPEFSGDLDSIQQRLFEIHKVLSQG